jgi:hypothetical protein
VYELYITLFLKSVLFIRQGWRKWTESYHKILFHSRSVCEINTSIGAEALWEGGSEPIKRFWVVISISRGKGVVRRRRETWRSKIDSNWGKHCCRRWVSHKWPSIRIKNDRIFEHPQECSSSVSEKGFGNEKVVCTFCSTLLDTWVEGRSSHIMPKHYHFGRYKHFFNKIITEDETWCFAYDPETKRQSSEWPKKLKFQKSRIRKKLIIFFDSLGVVHEEFVPEGKTVNSEFYAGVMDRLLKCIQRVRPAAFSFETFSCCTIMLPHTKLQVFANFAPTKCYNPLLPHTLQIYIRQTIFWSPIWKWS